MTTPQSTFRTQVPTLSDIAQARAALHAELERGDVTTILICIGHSGSYMPRTVRLSAECLRQLIEPRAATEQTKLI
jgi:hypothetical protein